MRHSESCLRLELLECSIPPGFDTILRNWDSAERTCPSEGRFLPSKETVKLWNTFLLSFNPLVVDFRSCGQLIPCPMWIKKQTTYQQNKALSENKVKILHTRLSFDSNLASLRQEILSLWFQMILPLFIRPALGGSTMRIENDFHKADCWVLSQGPKANFPFGKLRKWIIQVFYYCFKIVLCLYIFSILVKCYIALLHVFRDTIYLTKNSNKLYNINAKKKKKRIGGNISVVNTCETHPKKSWRKSTAKADGTSDRRMKKGDDKKTRGKCRIHLYQADSSRQVWTRFAWAWRWFTRVGLSKKCYCWAGKLMIVFNYSVFSRKTCQNYVFFYR